MKLSIHLVLFETHKHTAKSNNLTMSLFDMIFDTILRGKKSTVLCIKKHA